MINYRMMSVMLKIIIRELKDVGGGSLNIARYENLVVKVVG